jgi:hypothetical protein
MIVKKFGYTVEILDRNRARVRGGRLGENWHTVRTLLGKGDQNPKTKKNGLVSNVATWGLTMAPHNSARVGTMCAMAKTCKKPCLGHQGQGDMPNVMLPRIAKTVVYRLCREWFFQKLDRELNAKRRNNSGLLGLRPNTC